MTFEPAVTGLGVPIFVTDRSAEAATVVVAVPLLFAELVSEVEATEAVFDRTVPAATEASIFTTSVNG